MCGLREKEVPRIIVDYIPQQLKKRGIAINGEEGNFSSNRIEVN
jgi:hypothetical protein